MTDYGPKIEGSAQPIEALARMSRRGLLLILAAIMVLGGTAVAMAVAPASFLARWPGALPWLIPGATLIVYVAFRVGGRGGPPGGDSHREGMQAPDKLRQHRLARAHRAALIVALSAQIPLALLMKSLPVQNAVMGMGLATITIGMAALVACFVVFDWR